MTHLVKLTFVSPLCIVVNETIHFLLSYCFTVFLLHNINFYGFIAFAEVRSLVCYCAGLHGNYWTGFHITQWKDVVVGQGRIHWILVWIRTRGRQQHGVFHHFSSMSMNVLNLAWWKGTVWPWRRSTLYWVPFHLYYLLSVQQVIAGSGLAVGFDLISPSGHRLVSDFRQSEGIHTWVT